jgi:hypothetical protein
MSIDSPHSDVQLMAYFHAMKHSELQVSDTQDKLAIFDSFLSNETDSEFDFTGIGPRSEVRYLKEAMLVEYCYSRHEGWVSEGLDGMVDGLSSISEDMEDETSHSLKMLCKMMKVKLMDKEKYD